MRSARLSYLAVRDRTDYPIGWEWEAPAACGSNRREANADSSSRLWLFRLNRGVGIGQDDGGRHFRATKQSRDMAGSPKRLVIQSLWAIGGVVAVSNA